MDSYLNYLSENQEIGYTMNNKDNSLGNNLLTTYFTYFQKR